jgi:ABC-2 type transport system permease protein
MFKKYKPFFKAGMINALAYRSVLLTWLIVTFFQIACVIFLWIAVYANATIAPGQSEAIINGFTLKEIIVYFVFSNILTFTCFPGDTIWNINEDIKKGTIALQFTKPISYRLKLLFTCYGLALLPNLIFGLPLFIISYTLFAIFGFFTATSVWSVLFSVTMFIVLSFLSITLADGIDYFFGVLCFYTTSGWGLNLVKNTVSNLLGGSLLPLAFFKFGDFDASIIFNYLPFAGLVQNPVLALITDYQNVGDYLHVIHTVGLSIVWIIIIELINKLVFAHASTKVTVQGG